MPIVSYSQNFEDVMLSRALGAVKCGCYIDIGAQDPTQDSVSRHFYEVGWRGIHVEPHPKYAAMLRSKRVGDLVLQAAIGKRAGLVRFHAFDDTGLSTVIDEIASQHVRNGFSGELTSVPCITLDDLLDMSGFDEVHWMKLDVEGAEHDVIASWQSSIIRPWIILVEAVAPGERTDTARKYEQLLIAKGYHAVLFDGLNKYYVSDLRRDLDQYFSYGPSLWDEILVPQESRMARNLLKSFDAKTDAIIAKFGEEKASLEAALEDAQVAKVSSELRAAQSELATAQTNNQMLLELLNDQISAAKTANSRTAEAQNLAQAALSEAASARASRETLEAEFAQVRSAFNKTLVDLDRVKTELAEERSVLTGVLIDLAQVEVELTEERHALTVAQAEISRVNAELADKCTVLNNTFADFHAARNDLSQSLSRTSEVQEELEALKRDFVRNAQNYERSLDAAKLAQAKLEHQLKDLADRNSWLFGSLEALASASANASSNSIRSSIRKLLEKAPRSKVLLSEKNDYVAQSIDELLLVGQRQFVDACYGTLLGRHADPLGAAHFLERLASGDSRTAVILDIGLSKESIEFSPSTPGLDRLLARRRVLGVPLPSRLTNLLSLDRKYLPAIIVSDDPAPVASTKPLASKVLTAAGEQFLHQAYQLVLDRTPDPVGLQHFTVRLAAGDEKLDILALLRWSDEGQGRVPHEPSIEQATAWYRWRKWPFVGPLLRARAIRRWMPVDSHRLHQVEGQLAEIEHAVRTTQWQSCLMGRPLHLMSGHGTIAEAAIESISTALSSLGIATQAESGVKIKVFGDIGDAVGAQVWYVDGETAARLGTRQLPSTLEAIACTDTASAKSLIQLGAGIPVRTIGRAEREYQPATAMRLVQFTNDLDRVMDNPRFVRPQSLRIAVLTTWNTRCGIATHSEELIKAFPATDVQVIAPKNTEVVAPDQPNVHRIWDISKSYNQLNNVLEYLRSNPTDLLVIQYNFGFFSHPELNDFLLNASNLGVTVFVIFHSTHEPTNSEGWRLTELVLGLAKCGQIIVHTPRDVSSLANLGLNENVLLLPHGVQISNSASRVGKLSKEPILVTFGFCLPNKGLVELVQAIALLRQGGTSVKLRMLNALHTDPSSAVTAQAVKDEISKLSLSNAIELFTDFIDLETIDKEVASADLFINPYQFTSESASGAVRVGLRNKVPTVVTPLPIFDDLGCAAHRMPGTNPEGIARGILEAIQILRDPDQAKVWERNLNDWLNKHDFTTQAVRLDGICRTIRINALLNER